MESHICRHQLATSSVCQSLDELEFERGIWGAALDGNSARLEYILKKGIDPSISDSSGYTALHYAARNGKGSACKILLANGANPNAQTPGGATPLHRASYQGEINIVSVLLQYNADPMICDSDGKTALHKAAEKQHLAVAMILVTCNPSLKNIKDKKEKIPLDYVEPHNIELLGLLDP